MPSTSDKQRRTMAAAAHNPQFAKKVGIPVNVAKDFNQADQQQAAAQKDTESPLVKALRGQK